MKRIAIIGGGISGFVLAHQLSSNAKVVVFEKARGVGGRMSTRYQDPFCFDHGTQCFTARTREFQCFLEPYFKKGIISEWKGKVINLEIGKKETYLSWSEPHLVACQNMNSLCKILAEGIETHTSCEVVPLYEMTEQSWNLFDKTDQMLGTFDWVISTTPPAQTSNLFFRHISSNHPLRFANMRGCYALMLGFNRPWDREWIAARVRNKMLKWIYVNSSKPGRNPMVTCLVAHSRNDWAEAHANDDFAEKQALMLEQFSTLTGIDPKDADYTALHYWRYAIVDKIGKNGSYVDTKLRLAATGDWCETSRVEEVWFHANKLAAYIAQNIKYY